MSEIVRTIEIKKIQSDPNNVRKITSKSVKELAESIEAQGLLQPIGVRENSLDGYEVVYGNRRLEALKLLKREDVACVVVEATSQELAEIRATENLQRADLSPIESAKAVIALVEGGEQPAAVAKRMGKSLSWLNRRMTLLKLAPSLRKKLEKGDFNNISIAVLEELAALDPESQKVVWDDIYELTDTDLRGSIARYSHLLSSAVWDVEDKELDKKAGSCYSCQKRTGAQLFFFAEDRKEAKARCLDEKCWNRKLAAFIARKKEEAENSGEKHVLIGNAFELPETTPDEVKKAVVPSWNVDKVKKGTPGAIKGYVIAGEKAGETGYYKPKRGTQTTTGENIQAVKPLAERRKALKLRRELAVVKRLLDWVEAEIKQPVVARKLTHNRAASLAVVFGCPDMYGKKTTRPWEEQATVEDMTMAEIAGSLALGAMAHITGHLRSHLTMRQPDVDYCKGLCDAMSLDYYAIVAQVEAAIPDPKSWMNLNANGTPKAKSGQKPEKRDKKAKKRDKKGAIRPGVCKFCGCTEENACVLAGGESCSWTNKEKTICSSPDCMVQAAKEAPQKAPAKRKTNGPPADSKPVEGAG